ncbi:MAG: hypothetical protein HY712_00925 [candidate division NC10 bacterium]|nr:hypothetical protein [candidate division NC10 bacterium]
MATISPLQALVDRLENAPPPERGSGDPLALLLVTRLDHLAEPLAVVSSVLRETIYLVANDRQAAAVRAKGGTPYTPPEVAILRDLYAAVRPEVWAERLRLIHQAKRTFDGDVRGSAA